MFIQQCARTMKRAVLITALLAAATSASSAAAEKRQFEVAAGSAVQTLNEFSRQAGIQLLFDSDAVRSLRTQAVSGEMEVADALARLLGGTQLAFEFVNDRTIAVMKQEEKTTVSGKTTSAVSGANGYTRVAQAEGASSQPGSSATAATVDNSSQQRIELEEIVVTGTNIRGVEPSSPLMTITQEDIRLSGHNNLGEVMRSLPQNFSGGQNPAVLDGAGVNNRSNGNFTGASSPNLRGLGPDATLTLLNGTRLAYNGYTQATDISVIPVAAIDHVEVLLDGASAIYGSDAVGGVVNIILKRDYEGAELSARYGETADGGAEQTQYSGVAGTTWASGGILLTGDTLRTTQIRAGQRDYLSYLPNQKITIQPRIEQHSGLVSGHQRLGDSAEFILDAFYSERQMDHVVQPSAFSFFTLRSDDANWGAAPKLRFTLPGEWSLRLNGFYGRDEAENFQPSFAPSTGARIGLDHFGYTNKVEALGVEAEGAIFTLPGGEARLSAGAGYRKSAYEAIDLLAAAVGTSGSDRSYYGYGEIFLPLVAKDQRIPLVSSLSLNGAVRHENYQSFGETTTPKIGVNWDIVPSFSVKASWGRSFKVPTLEQQFSRKTLDHFPAFFFAGGPDDATIFYEFGGSLDLTPERAEIVTAGFVAKPEFLPGFGFELSWFDIDYTDRVLRPHQQTGQALINPDSAEFVTFAPTVAQQNAAFAAAGLAVGAFDFDETGAPYDSSTVYAIVHDRLINATSQKASGVDIIARYTTNLFHGSFTTTANASWIDGERMITSLAPERPTTGVVFFPVDFKGRLSAAWSRSGFTFSSSINHITGVTDNNVSPAVTRDSMTTFDLVIDYQVESSLLGGIGFNLTVLNVFNEDPPFMQPARPNYVNYDSTNYSSVGRFVSATVRKRF